MKWMTKGLLSAFWLSAATSASATCSFESWLDYEGDHLFTHPTRAAYIFVTSHKAADADGAPNAYHPEDIGLDYLANAGYPNTNWWKDVLVADPANPKKAYRQTDGLFEGYFVSKTSLQDLSKRETDPSRYVDATNVPFFVLPGSFYKLKGTGRLGDLGYAFNLATGDSSPFVVADIGPRKAKLGEISVALAEGIGGRDVNPRNGSGLPPGKVLYILFPNSSRSNTWPLTIGKIKQASEAVLEAVGGMHSVMECRSKF